MMSRITMLVVSIFFMLALLALSETVTLATDNIPHNMPKYEFKHLEASKHQEILNNCKEQDLFSSKNNTVSETILKDSDNKLAFITESGTIELSLEEYLVGVVISEVPYTFEIEAIKAQAVAARTYAIRELVNGTRHGKGTLCGEPSHCSAYMTRENYIERYGEDEYNKAYEIVKRAVNETDGNIITYDGEPCCAVYHSSSEGYTENSYNLWGTETPYLKSVKSFESGFESTVEVNENKMNSVLSHFGNVGNNPSDISIAYNNSGRCDSLKINGVNVSASKMRTAFGLKSCDFKLGYENGIYTFTVYGYGHGIGLSQYGANEMAKSGNIWSDILLHYYTGVEIESIK